jgi:hypothetical protein
MFVWSMVCMVRGVLVAVLVAVVGVGRQSLACRRVAWTHQ